MECAKIGDVVSNRFRLEKLVGAGSFAWVFAATDTHSGKTVALKILRPERLSDEDALRRFETRELRMLARIANAGGSPHVVRLLENHLLRHDGLPFLVLEFISGPSLQEMLAERAPLSIGETARIGMGLARGLSVIHASGGVHRDLKPSNVRMRDEKTPVLVDLGIARALWETQKLTQNSAAPLTPRYAAPEQLDGLPATSAADVYALGVCLFEMLTGHSSAPTDPRAFRQEVPKRFADLVVACLDSRPHARPSVTLVLRTLDTFAGNGTHRISPWPVVFMAGCSVFPGTGFQNDAFNLSSECTPFVGFSMQQAQKGASPDDTILQWSTVGADGEVSARIEVHLPRVDQLPIAVIDDGSDGSYEVLGWSAEDCRHFSVRACAEGHAIVKELAPCDLPRPIPVSKANVSRGDFDRDGVEDIVTSRQVPGTPEHPIQLRGITLHRHNDGSSTLIDNAFDLSAIDAYHMETLRRLGDIDRDGCADLVVNTYPNGGACSSSIYVFLGDCRGKFVMTEDVAYVPLPVNKPDIGDVDEDGWLDLVTGPDDDGDPGQTFLLRGNGYGFGEAEEAIDVFPDIEHTNDQAGFGGVLLDDWNADGHLDVIVTHTLEPWGNGPPAQRSAIYLGRGDGTFDDPPTFTHSTKHAGISFLPIRGR